MWRGLRSYLSKEELWQKEYPKEMALVEESGLTEEGEDVSQLEVLARETIEDRVERLATCH